MTAHTSPQRALKRQLTALVARMVRRPALDVEQLPTLQPRRILIVRQHNQMGDMVCATPVFRALAETYPGAEMGLVTAPVNREVVQGNPHLNRIFCFEQTMWRRPWRLLRFLRELRQYRADLTFILSSVSFSVTSAAIGLAAGSTWVVGADSLPFGFDLSRHAFSLEMPSLPGLDRHAVEHSLAPLQAVGITTADRSTVVVPTSENEQQAREIINRLGLRQGFWALHPGAGKKQNIWPAQRFAEMAGRAAAAGHQVLLLHGPADQEALAGVRRELDAESQALVVEAPACSIGTGAALLRQTERFLCNDTGVMHVAGAVGVPTVALFGPTDPAFWKPPSDLVVAVKSSHQTPDPRGGEFGWMENITTDTVWQTWDGLSVQNGNG